MQQPYLNLNMMCKYFSQAQMQDAVINTSIDTTTASPYSIHIDHSIQHLKSISAFVAFYLLQSTIVC